MTYGYDIGPDIEVAADEFEAQQKVLAEMGGVAMDMTWQEELAAERQMALENATEEAWAAMKDGDPIPVFNSCDALRIIDGVKPLPEGEE